MNGQRVVVLVLVLLCLGADGAHVPGQVILADAVEISLVVDRSTVATGQHAGVAAVVSGLDGREDVTVELHAPADATVRPRATVELRRPRGDDTARWRFCRDTTGQSVLVAGVTWTTAVGATEQRFSDAVVVNVVATPSGRRCGG